MFEQKGYNAHPSPSVQRNYGFNLLRKLSSAAVRALAVTVLFGSTWTFAQTLTTIYNMGADPNDGADPERGIIFDKAGNIYGMDSIGGFSRNEGTIFKLVRPAQSGGQWEETILHQFTGAPDGNTPEGRLVLTSTGKLVGTTSRGGAHDMGTAFVAFPTESGDDSAGGKIVYSFGSFLGDGINPNAGLLAAPGKFFGVTIGGGTKNRGTVYQLTPSADGSAPWTETVLYSFRPAGDAAFPAGELLMDKSGNLYGVTTQGGAHNLGAIYELSPPAVPGGSWTETVIHSFNGTDGTLPSGRLVFDADGALVGTTDGGGSQREGTVFKLAPPANPGDPWIETVLINFSGGREGGNPETGVVIDNAGRIFGAASSGGAGGPDFGGVIFRLDPPAVQGAEWKETVLHHFGGPDGFRPVAPPVLRDDGIYGTTMLGGDFGTGTIFVITR
jgi:uncharacterized repeat protein (TIGR03803 family)